MSAIDLFYLVRKEVGVRDSPPSTPSTPYGHAPGAAIREEGALNEDTREKHDGTGNTGFEDGTYDVMTIAACVVVAPTKGTWRSDLVAP